MTPQERAEAAQRAWYAMYGRHVPAARSEQRITPLQAALLGFRRHADDSLHAELSAFRISVHEERPEPREWR